MQARVYSTFHPSVLPRVAGLLLVLKMQVETTQQTGIRTLLNRSGRARKSSLRGSLGRLDWPFSMEVFKHDVPQWYMACESSLCSHPQAGESREDKAPEQQERKNDLPVPVGDKEPVAPTGAQEHPRQTCTISHPNALHIPTV